MLDLTAAIDDAWTMHGRHPDQVLAQIEVLIPLATTPEQLMQLAHVGVHVQGEHLGRWQAGLAFLQQIASSPLFVESSPMGSSWHRHRAVLLIAAGDDSASKAEQQAIACDPAVPPASHRVRIHAIAAATVAAHQRIDEARHLMEIALDAAAYGPTKADPASRALATSAHNLAVDLAKTTNRDAAATDFMLELARISGHWWAIAGGALEVERAEYRLAMCHLAALNASKALVHAQRCLAMSLAEGMKPSEQVYAQMAVAECQHVLGNRTAASTARDAAVAIIPRLIPQVAQEAEADLLELDRKLAQAPPEASSR